MLTSADDSLWHQLPTTFDHVGTSDPRFYDRYWFAAYDPEGRTAVQVTLGAYRNMDVMDAAAVLIVDGIQHNVRASRILGAEIEPSCGPITVDMVEPLKAFSLKISCPEGDVHGQLDWRGILPPEEEHPHFRRVRRRVVDHHVRFNQIGVVTGWLEVGSEQIEVNEWWGCRDHSWGVRPRMGVPEPVTGPKRELRDRGFAMAFLFFSTDELAGHVHLQHHSQESPYITGVVRDRGETWAHEVTDADLDVDLQASSRRFRRARLDAALDDGRRLPLLVEALGPSVVMRGLGYSGGYHDGAGLGAWRGDGHLEIDRWDVSSPTQVIPEDGDPFDHWHRIQPVRVAADGDRASTGTGSMTMILSGSLPEYGLA